jgi:hypothetical protein
MLKKRKRPGYDLDLNKHLYPRRRLKRRLKSSETVMNKP